MLWVFDVNETMLDLSALDPVFERYAGAPGARTEWFDLLIRGALVVTATGGYQDFAQLGAACARAVARARGTEFSDVGMQELAATMRALPAHPEVPAALSRLRERGHRPVALANSPQAVVDAQLENAGLAVLLDGVYSVERAGVLKPAPAAYRLRGSRWPPPAAFMAGAGNNGPRSDGGDRRRPARVTCRAGPRAIGRTVADN